MRIVVFVAGAPFSDGRGRTAQKLSACFGSVPNENPVHPAADVIPQGTTAKFKPFKQFADLLECSKGNSQMHPCKRSVLGRPMSEPSKGRA